MAAEMTLWRLEAEGGLTPCGCWSGSTAATRAGTRSSWHGSWRSSPPGASWSSRCSSAGRCPSSLAGLADEEAEEAEPIFEEARAKLAGIPVETRAFGGASPAAILTVLAEEEGFDAIVDRLTPSRRDRPCPDRQRRPQPPQRRAPRRLRRPQGLRGRGPRRVPLDRGRLRRRAGSEGRPASEPKSSPACPTRRSRC